MLEISQVFIVFSMAAFVVMVLVLYGILNMLRRLKKSGEQKDPSQVTFVVETFKDLVAELKEKESELESMKTKAEERADIMEDYNENILQSVPSGVVSMDSAWMVVKANASACRILGLAMKDLAGHDGREIFGEIIRQTVDPDGIPIWPGRGELRYMASSGKRLWLGYSLSPLKDFMGAEIGRLLVFTDLTELKALEEQAALRKRLSSLGEMAAGIAHELRNPMAVIAGYTRILRKNVGPEAVSTVNSIAAEVDVMEKIIMDFLTFARPRNIELMDINLRALVMSCIQKVRTAGDDGAHIAVNIDSGLNVRVDEVMFRQALTNLLVNALDATPPEGSISLDAAIDGDDVVLKVSDTGHGIDKAVADRIFIPFYTTKDKGTGLGLALVHRIITSHCGSINLSSGKGGTTFTITLPRNGPPDGGLKCAD